VRIYSFDNSDSIESSIVLYLGSAAPFIPYFWRALVNARRKEEQREEGVTMAASATGGGQSRELRRKLSLERRVASRRRRPRTLPLGRLRPPPPAEERSCATYTYIVKPRLIVARFHTSQQPDSFHSCRSSTSSRTSSSISYVTSSSSPRATTTTFLYRSETQILNEQHSFVIKRKH
jgi:hypothetical protein